MAASAACRARFPSTPKGRRLRLSWFWGLQPVAEASLGDDQFGTMGIGFQLLTEMSNVHIQGTGAIKVIDTPHATEQLIPGDRLTGP